MTWQPKRRGTTQSTSPYSEIKSCLNKITPEKYDTIVPKMLIIFEKLGKTIDFVRISLLIFQKAQEDRKISTIYVRLCVSIIEQKPKFKQFLLNTVHAGFFSISSINLTEEKWRVEGILIFVGELYRSDIISTAIFQDCIQKLLPSKDILEGEVFAVCELLKIGGGKWYSSVPSKIIDFCFTLLTQIYKRPQLSSLVKFQLEEMFQFRISGWKKDYSQELKTIEQHRKESGLKEEDFYKPPPTFSQSSSQSYSQSSSQSYSQSSSYGVHYSHITSIQKHTVPLVKTSSTKDQISFLYHSGKGNISELQTLYDTKQIDINFSGKKGFTALHKASWSGHLDTVKLLIKWGAIVKKNDYGETPLEAAETAKHEHIISYLLSL